ncbi:MAG: two-component system response regulator, partial [Lachnospiraceae bacterium]|nr:two-component system response regulator [Lachnospiraceae bacterium]
DHLAGDDIPISAQIVAVADVYDALVSPRVYKDPFSKQKAFEMIMNGECGQFSPDILKCFELAREDFFNIMEVIENFEFS